MLSPKAARERIEPKPSQEEVARKAGVSIATIRRAEANGKWPSHQSTREAYQRALGVIEQVSA
jgi:transcriptional regulator with XRE-family HTH domain